MRFDLLLANALATMALAITFQAPRKEYFFCLLTGAFSYLGFWAFSGLDSSGAAPTIASTVLLTVAARVLTRLRQRPSTIYIMAGIVPLVNGMGLFRMIQAVIGGELSEATMEGIHVLRIGISIAVGLGIGFSIPHRCFHWLCHGRKAKDSGDCRLE